jgi:capsular polysaccharide biosynthesis protein
MDSKVLYTDEIKFSYLLNIFFKWRIFILLFAFITFLLSIYFLANLRNDYLVTVNLYLPTTINGKTALNISDIKNDIKNGSYRTEIGNKYENIYEENIKFQVTLGLDLESIKVSLKTKNEESAKDILKYLSELVFQDVRSELEGLGNIYSYEHSIASLNMDYSKKIINYYESRIAEIFDEIENLSKYSKSSNDKEPWSELFYITQLNGLSDRLDNIESSILYEKNMAKIYALNYAKSLDNLRNFNDALIGDRLEYSSIPMTPKKSLIMLIFLFVGLLLGALFALFFEFVINVFKY